MSQTIDLLKNSSFENKMDELIEAIGSKSVGSVAFSVTLLSSEWNANKQTILDNNFVTEGFSYTVSPQADSITNYMESEIYASDITVNGQITFNCSNVPTNDIVVNIVKTGVK